MSTLSRATWRELRQRPLQFLSVGLVLALGVGLFAASFDAFLNLTSSYEQLYRETRMAHVTAFGGPTDQVLRAARALPGVEATATRTVADVPLQPRDGHRLLGRLVGMPADGDAAVDAIRITQGGQLDPAVPQGVVVEQHMARHFGLAPGDRLQVIASSGSVPLQALGVAASPEYLWPARSRQEILVLPDDFGVVFAPEPLVRTVAGETAREEVLVRLADDAPPGEIEAARQALLQAGAADAYTLEEQPSNAALQEDVSGFAEMSVMFPAFFLIAAAFATYVILGRTVAAREADIGTLRASGYRGRTILRQYASIGIVLGALGALAGVILGAVLAEAVTRLYTGALSIPASVIEVRPATILAGLLTGTLTGAVAAYLPARAASRIPPAAAMRGPVPGGGGSPALARSLPGLRRLPVRWRSAIRGIGRARRRSLATIVGVVLATMLILVSWSFVDTISVLLEQQFGRIQRYDAQLRLAGASGPTTASTIASVEGVQDVELALVLPVTVVGPAGSYSTQLTALQPGASMHALIRADGSRLPIPEDGVVLGQAMRDELALDSDARVTLQVAGMPPLEDVPVVGYVREPLGTFAYTSLAFVASRAAELAPAGPDAAGPPANVAMVTFEAGADRAAMRERLSSLPVVAAVLDSRALYDLVQEYMGLFYAFIGVMVVLGGVLAFALIYNTMSANVAERQAELAVLRILGLSRRTIGSMVTAQNLLLTVIGILPGLVLGWLLAWVFMATFSSDMFIFELTIRPLTFVLTALAIVVVGLLSQLPALRAVGRLDLGRIVRDRSF